jgi:dynein heavy chain
LRCDLKYVKDTQLLAAMAPPGGGRNHFSQRINACFSTVNMTQPNNAQLKRIFSTLLNMKLAEFDDDVRPLAEPIVAASVEIYRAVSRELLPTPSKSHYLFNTRDLAKIVLGVMQVCTHVSNGLLLTPPAPTQNNEQTATAKVAGADQSA